MFPQVGFVAVPLSAQVAEVSLLPINKKSKQIQNKVQSKFEQIHNNPNEKVNRIWSTQKIIEYFRRNCSQISSGFSQLFKINFAAVQNSKT
jgi:hypothetical protein